MNPARILFLIFIVALTLMSRADDAATTKSTSLIPPPRRDVPGSRVDLEPGVQLYVPDFFDAAGRESIDIVLFFHGAAWCAEQNFHDSKRNAVLVTVNGKELEKKFSDEDAFWAIVNATTETLSLEKPAGKIVLSSFSGGYAAIRAILRQEKLVPLISDVVLADSLYAGRVSGTENELLPNQMEPFVNYAQRAARGEAIFLFSHLYPPEEKYRSNTTTLAADYLLDRTGAKKRHATGTNSAGAELLYRADLNGFHVLGYSGMTTQDHFNHFYAISDLWRETSLERVTRSPE